MPVTTTYNEQLLLQNMAAGNQQAFTQLFDQYWDHIYGVAWTLTRSRENARDIVQEIFIKIWLQREELPGKDSFRNYLFIVARNHILSTLRKKLYESPWSEQLQQWYEDSAARPDERLFYQESQNLVWQAIDQLPLQQKQVYQLSRDHGWSQEEIAQHLHISKNTVKTHMSRALAAIREHLDGHATGLLLAIALMEAFL